jgi:hypothetical protein
MIVGVVTMMTVMMMGVGVGVVPLNPASLPSLSLPP